MEGKIKDSIDEEMRKGGVRAMCYPLYPATTYYGQEIKALREQQMIFGEGCKVVVFGCGGHARSVVNVIRETDKRAEIILVDRNAKENEIILGCTTERKYEIEENDVYIIAVGDNRERNRLYCQIKKGYKGFCIPLLSVFSQIGEEVIVGNGTFIAPNAYVGPQAEIGDNTIINTGSVIEHEVQIGSHTHVAPNATICGRSRIGNYVFCGAGSIVADNIYVCDDVVIGAGAVVTRNITVSGTYVGVPARKIS